MIKISIKFIAILSLLTILVSFTYASYSFKITVKFPFITTHLDSLGNEVSDSLVRYRDLRVTIYRTDFLDSLSQVEITSNSGEAFFTFDCWNDGQIVDINNIVQMKIAFPNTKRVTKVGELLTFEPLIFEDVRFKITPESLQIILPPSVHSTTYSIGSGPYSYAFAIMADMHVAEGAKLQNGMEDFGTIRWNDSDNDPNETTPAVDNDKYVVAAINQLINPPYNAPIKFVVALGDITGSSEKSEYERALKILGDLLVPYIPICGNHDMRPYVGGWGNYAEAPVQVKHTWVVISVGISKVTATVYLKFSLSPIG